MILTAAAFESLVLADLLLPAFAVVEGFAWAATEVMIAAAFAMPCFVSSFGFVVLVVSRELEEGMPSDLTAAGWWYALGGGAGESTSIFCD